MKACCTCMTNKAEKEIGRGFYKQVSNTITNHSVHEDQLVYWVAGTTIF